MRTVQLLILLSTLLPAAAVAQSGKVAGRVTDAGTGDPLPGVSVVIDGSTQGSVTDVDGYYAILNVRPGTHTVRASYVGYTPILREDVRVQIDLTSTVDFQMTEGTVGLGEVIVTAEQPVIQQDIAGSQRNISIEEIQGGRYQSVTNVIAAQVGVEATSAFNDRPNIRGSSMEQSQFIVDGVAQGDPLTNRPFYKVNLDAVEEIKMQTGGFSAEYGNLRSATIEVVTKEGGDHYFGSATMQYSPPALKHFGPMMFGFDSPVVQPFVNPAAGAFSGNDFFPGWNAIVHDQGKAGPYYLPDDAPQADVDRNAQELYARWLWRHRSQDAINELKKLQSQGVVTTAPGVNLDDQVWQNYGDMPDYRTSVTLGGPVPLLNALKFFVSYTGEQTEYSYSFPEPAYKDHSLRGKITTNLGTNTKLNLEGFYSTQIGGSRDQGPGIDGFITSNPYAVLGSTNKMWYPNCAVPGQQSRQQYSARLVHTASASTFYELTLSHSRTDYKMLPQNRDTAPLKSEIEAYSLKEGLIGTDAEANAKAADPADFPGWTNWQEWARIRIGDYWYDEAPKGYGPVNWRDVTGEYRMESCNLRINNTYSRAWQMKGAVTSQVNRHNQVKAGFEVARTNLNEYYYALDPSVNGGSLDKSEGKPWTMGLFALDKLEFKGFVANVGLRLDGIYHSKYPVLDGVEGDPNSPYSEFLLAGNTDSLWQNIPTKRVAQFRVSPRIGISHPISTVGKLFFNYGHMYQWPNGFNTYRIRYDTRGGNRIDNYGNPLARPPRTIQYEIGYEHNLFDKMSLRLTGYYKDVNDELDDVDFNPLGQDEYTIQDNSRFKDIRGFEAFLELRRNVIPFVSGWVSYNYKVESGGRFGYDDFYEDPTRQPSLVSSEVSSPDVRPLIKAAFDFQTPDQFGPGTENFSLLGGLNVNLLYTWQRGGVLDWNPAEIPLVEDNVRWAPYQRWDMRVTKSLFQKGPYQALFFVDVTNLFNNRNMTQFEEDQDVTTDQETDWAWSDHKWWKNQFEEYMYSMGYTADNEQEDGSFLVNGKKVKLRPGDWKDDGIAMPGFTPWTFLEKRDIFFGIKLYF
ncbi:MAG TPA: carboxypeptidase-like regulatory domain-containing protein [Rhodothermales bacterium]|nr:carboxypeptidase-like regulatory domain-containing protein [Rhodothermales bacterium]